MSEQNPDSAPVASEQESVVAALLAEYHASKQKYSGDPLVNAMAEQLAHLAGMSAEAAVAVAHLMPPEPTAEPVQADVVGPISGYLRVCRNGGMSKKRSDTVLDAVTQAQELGYFEMLRAPANLDSYDRERILNAGRILQWIVDCGTAEPLDESMVGEASAAVRLLGLVLGMSKEDRGAQGLAGADTPAAVTGTTALGALTLGWRHAAVAWDVCASIHRTYAKKTDALFITRQQDFVRNAAEARARFTALPGPLFSPR